MMNQYRNRISLWVALLLLVAFTVGCNLSSQALATTEAPPPPPTNTTAPTQAPTDTAVPPTDTAVPPTDTPVPPTDTPVPTDTPDLAATEAAQATEAAAVLIGQIDETLKVAGLTTADGGSLAWSQAGDPVVIKVDTYGQTLFDEIDPALKYKDFVWRVKITWDSTGGLAGCGLIFAGENDLERGEQYRFYTLRLSGLPAWDIERWKFNYMQANVTGQVRTSAAIDQKASATNEYLVVARGSTITVYGNGERMGVASDTRRIQGQFAFFTFQESGITTCTFSDSWIWALP
jgi:hypothetical protein